MHLNLTYKNATTKNFAMRSKASLATKMPIAQRGSVINKPEINESVVLTNHARLESKSSMFTNRLLVSLIFHST